MKKSISNSSWKGAFAAGAISLIALSSSSLCYAYVPVVRDTLVAEHECNTFSSSSTCSTGSESKCHWDTGLNKCMAGSN